MLIGQLAGEKRNAGIADRRVVVIGAGAAGASAANRLAARGFEVTVIERAARPGEGASGNKAGVFRPLPTLDDSKLSRLLRACFLYGHRHIALLPGVRFGITGALQLARDAKHEDIQRRVIDAHAAPPELMRFVDRDEASQLAAWPVAVGGWWFATAGWINPPSLCRANLEGISVRFNCTVDRIERAADGLWQLFDVAGALLAKAPLVVLANGIDAPRLVPALPVRVGRGLVSHLPEKAVPPFGIVATRNGYVTPAVDGIHCAGATLNADDMEPNARLSDYIENGERLNAILPNYGKDLDPAKLEGRVGFRPMSPDRLPLVGPLTDPGLWTINGFGARGLVWASLCGELLAAQIADDPLPIEADLVRAVEPNRFATRDKKHRRV
jgi:tRNA 5-methylaminomethyl-2-thiouridine biosynthesis bifunctional protein